MTISLYFKHLVNAYLEKKKNKIQGKEMEEMLSLYTGTIIIYSVLFMYLEFQFQYNLIELKIIFDLKDYLWLDE